MLQTQPASAMRAELSAPTPELRAFLSAHCCADHDVSTLEALVSGFAEDRMVVVRDAGEPTLLGCVVRDLANPDQASEIILLAGLEGAGLPPALGVLQDRAEQLVLAGKQRRIELQVPARLTGIEPVLERLGYYRAWENIRVELEPLAPRRRQRCTMPDGAAWQDVDDRTVEASYRCYARAFRTVPGGQVPSLEDYARVLPPLVPPQRILVRSGQVLAFVRAGWACEPTRTGEIFSLGTDPDALLPGLGALTVGEAVRVLGLMGATRAELTVSSRNLLARGLYARFGFTEKCRRAVLHKDLRGDRSSGDASGRAR